MKGAAPPKGTRSRANRKRSCELCSAMVQRRKSLPHVVSPDACLYHRVLAPRPETVNRSPERDVSKNGRQPRWRDEVENAEPVPQTRDHEAFRETCAFRAEGDRAIRFGLGRGRLSRTCIRKDRRSPSASTLNFPEQYGGVQVDRMFPRSSSCRELCARGLRRRFRIARQPLSRAADRSPCVQNVKRKVIPAVHRARQSPPWRDYRPGPG